MFQDDDATSSCGGSHRIIKWDSNGCLQESCGIYASSLQGMLMGVNCTAPVYLYRVGLK